MSEIAIGGHDYRCGKLATRTQLHVVKRLIPVVQGLAPLFAAGSTQLTPDENGALVPGFAGINLYEALAALANTVGLLSDADSDFILDAALDAVRWKQGERWVPLRAPGGALMLAAADDLAVQLRLLWEVLAESLANFSFATLLPSQATNGIDQMATATAA